MIVTICPAKLDYALMHQAVLAERYGLEDPN
jgi:hypothetical protein